MLIPNLPDGNAVFLATGYWGDYHAACYLPAFSINTNRGKSLKLSAMPQPSLM